MPDPAQYVVNQYTTGKATAKIAIPYLKDPKIRLSPPISADGAFRLTQGEASMNRMIRLVRVTKKLA